MIASTVLKSWVRRRAGWGIGIVVIGLVGLAAFLLIARRAATPRTPPIAPAVAMEVKPGRLGNFVVFSVTGLPTRDRLVSLEWIGPRPLVETAALARVVGLGGDPDGRTTFEVVHQRVIFIFTPAMRGQHGMFLLRYETPSGVRVSVRSAPITLGKIGKS